MKYAQAPVHLGALIRRMMPCTLLLLAAGCSCRVVLTPVSARVGQLSVRLTTQGGACGDTPQIGYVAVYRGAEPAPIWYLSTGTGGPVPLTALTYGTPPRGFSQSQPAPPLTSGTQLRITARGPGMAGALEVVPSP